MSFVIVAVAVLVAFGLGVYEGPKLTGLYAKFTGSRAVKSAQALVTAAEANAAALAAARKLIASQPAPVVVTGTTGPTGTA